MERKYIPLQVLSSLHQWR